MRGRAISVALALALTLVATLAAGQAHGGKSAFALRSAKQHDGPYKVFTRVAIEQGDQRTTWWRVKNKSATDEESMNFSDLGGDAPGYKVQWFRGQENISAEVEDQGYEFDLAAGQARYFSSRIKRTGPEEDNCVQARVWDFEHSMASDASMNVNTNKCGL